MWLLIVAFTVVMFAFLVTFYALYRVQRRLELLSREFFSFKRNLELSNDRNNKLQLKIKNKIREASQKLFSSSSYVTNASNEKYDEKYLRDMDKFDKALVELGIDLQSFENGCKH